MVEKISIQIGLDGGKQVEQQLVDIGDAGQTMAVGIAKAGNASQTTGAEFDALVAATDKLTEATNKAIEAHSKLSLETVKTTVAIAKYTAEIALTGVEIVQAVRHHDTLIQSLIKLVGITNTTVRVVSLLTPELALVGVTIGSTVAAVAAGVVAFEALEKIATKAAAGYEKLNHSLQMLADTSGQSFKALQEGKDALEQLGIGGERFEGIITKINEGMSSLDISSKFAEGADNIAKAGALTSEHFKALANNMGAVLPLVKQIEEGVKGLTFDPLTTAQTKIDAVTASMKQAADAGKNAGQVLLQFIVSADKLSAIQVGKAFGITEEDVDRIRRLAANGVTVAEIFKRIQGTGVLISPESAAAFDKMRDSIAQADSAWVRFKQAMASTIFADLGAQASSVMNDIKARVLNTAAAIVEAFNSAATQAIAALKTIGQSDFGQTINQTVQNAVTGLNSIIANLVGGILQGMGVSAQAIKAVQDQINGIGPAAQQAGSQAAQGLQLVTNPLTGMPELINTTNQALQQTGQAGADAGQQAAQGLQLVTNPLTGMPQLINTTNQALQQTGQAGADAGQQAAQGFQVWNEELGKAVPNTQQVTSAMQQATTAVSDFISKIASLTWDSITSAGVAAWNAITAAIQGAIDRLLQFLGLQSRTPAPKTGGDGKASGGLIGGRGTGTSDSNLAWLSRGEYIMPASAVRQPGVLSFLEALRRSGSIPGFAEGGAVKDIQSDRIGSLTGTALVGGIEQVIESLKRLAQTAFQSSKNIYDNLIRLGNQIVDNAQSVFNTIDRIAQSVTDNSNRISDEISHAVDALQAILNQATMKARGGLLGGRGTGTSDSNLAWVSRGEHIMPARAVAQPGVLSFLEALRRSGGNLRSVLDGMGRFALGGMVRGPMPAFAAGGLAGGMSNVTIQFPGLPAIGGLRASSDVVDQLHKAAALAQVRSGGRKPSRYS